MRTLLTLLVLAIVTVISAPGFAQDDDAKSDDAESAEGAEGEGEEGAEAEGEAADATATSTSNIKRGNRMEFDARLIRGERASGAVFLFQRETRPLPSMVKRRTSYLDDTVRGTLGPQSAEEFREKQAEAQRRRLEAEEEEKRKARGKATTQTTKPAADATPDADESKQNEKR